MTEATIRCPKCQAEIPLTEAMAGPLLEKERKNHAAQLAVANNLVELRTKELSDREAALEATVAARARQLSLAEVERQRKEVERAANDRIEQANRSVEFAREQAGAMAAKLKEAQADQAEAVRKSRELDDARRELELTVAKRVVAETAALHEKLKIEVTEENRLRVAEKEHLIRQMADQIEDLKRKAEQGSAQIQGEVQELELERELAMAFPIDTIEPIGKGIHGADCLQVVTTVGGIAGGILWESKRTKNWGGDWLSKLRDDLRANKRADVAVIVSRVLPDEVKTFGLVENVWVTAPAYAIPLAVALRATLTGLAAVRAANVGQAQKAVLVYQYLTGAGFRGRIEAVVERFTEMREDLDRERKFVTKQLAKREEQLGQVVAAMSGLYGDLQGIAGRDVAELGWFALPELKEKL